MLDSGYGINSDSLTSCILHPASRILHPASRISHKDIYFSGVASFLRVLLKEDG